MDERGPSLYVPIGGALDGRTIQVRCCAYFVGAGPLRVPSRLTAACFFFWVVVEFVVFVWHGCDASHVNRFHWTISPRTMSSLS